MVVWTSPMRITEGADPDNQNDPTGNYYAEISFDANKIITSIFIHNPTNYGMYFAVSVGANPLQPLPAVKAHTDFTVTQQMIRNVIGRNVAYDELNREGPQLR